MSIRLSPYLMFQDTAREAMEFYRQIFGGELAVNTFGEFGDQGASGSERVMHSELTTQHGFTLMAGDAPDVAEHLRAPGISVNLTGDETDTLRRHWELLTAGGAVIKPLERQVWGDEFGICTDRYGINWMINICAPTDRA